MASTISRDRVVDKKAMEAAMAAASELTAKQEQESKPAAHAAKASSQQQSVDYGDDDYDYSSSDEELESEDDDGPPPMIQIERSADLGSLKAAFQTIKDKVPVKTSVVIEERFGKENLSDIANSFEKPTQSGPKEREKITLVDKEQYSSVKNKFEHMSEEMENKEKERRTVTDTDLLPDLGDDNVAERKTRYEKIKDQQASGNEQERKQIEIERSDADRKRVKEKFFEPSDKEESRECAVCGKMVYSVEKLLLEKRVYHKACFKCHTCQKALSVQGYTAHEGNLFCKLHILEIYRPEAVLAHEGALESEMIEPEDDEDYVLVTKPKILDPSVVRSGFKTTDDLENVPKLQNMKARWEEPVEQKTEKRTDDVEAVIQQGKVKSRLSRFTEGAGGSDKESVDEEDETRDPNIVRESKKKKQQVQVEVDAKTIKSKWETGAVENVKNELEDRSQELEELKKSVSVKDRYKEKTKEDDVAGQRCSIIEDENLDTSFTKTAKERFQKGEAYQDNGTAEKSKEDIHFAEMGNVKQRFEKGQSIDDKEKTDKPRTDLFNFSEMDNIKAAFEQKQQKGDDKNADIKKLKIEAEFKRINKEKRLYQEREKRESEDVARDQTIENKIPEEVRQSADMSSIKKRFEEGKAFQKDDDDEPKQRRVEDEVEIKVAGKAREKFKKIDQEVPKERAQETKSLDNSKWNTENRAMPEPVNRRVLQDDDDDNPEEYEMRNVLSKFKTIEQQAGQDTVPKGPKPKRQITPPPEGYRAETESDAMERNPDVITGAAATNNGDAPVIKVQAKSIMEKFEKGPEALVPEGPTAKDKRKQIEEEFLRIKEMKEQERSAEEAKPPEPEEPHQETDTNPDLAALTAGRAQKARAKWDKIQRKEARKAEKVAKRAAVGTKETS